MKTFQQYLTELIKLRGLNSKTKKIEQFLQDYYANTEDHPFNSKVRIYKGAMLEISPWGNEIHIGDITSTAPRSGAGTAGIKFLTSLADKHNVKLDLTAKAYSNDSKRIGNTEKLARWYQRLGFKVDPTSIPSDDFEGLDQIDMKYWPGTIGKKGAPVKQRKSK
jgi:hypothetical protein